MANSEQYEKKLDILEKTESFYEVWERIKDSQAPSEDDPAFDIDEEIFFSEKEAGEYNLKIVLIGDGAVGKTSLRRSYLGEGFEANYQQTIGADFAIYTEQVGSFKVKFVIWDLAGQLMFHQVRKSFYKGCHGALIVCDITNPTSFDNLRDWINELWKNNDLGPVPFVILGNKEDLRRGGGPTVPKERIHRVARIINRETRRQHGFGTKSIITSAKTGDGVRESFKQLAIQIIALQRFRTKQKNQNSN
ncbi:MAG: Rab family GTPase [Candidatus Hodarchaeales archaeon]|jgi:small GTP-binding protein